MHDCLRWHMRVLRWSGIFPVEGLENPTIQGLRFKLKSFYGIYYFITFLGQMTLTILSAVWCFSSTNYSPASITTFILQFTALIALFLMLKLSKHWPILLKRVARIESQIRDIRKATNVKKQCHYMLWGIGILCIVEHLLAILCFVRIVWYCNLVENYSIEFFEVYFKHNAPYVFDYTTLAAWKMIIFKLVKMQTILLWGLTDVIPMSTCLYLISYIQDLNDAITRRTDIKFWEKHRMHYTRLDRLVSMVDESLRAFVLFLFFNYLYFISVQLFYLLNDDESRGQVVYYLFSSMFLIIRALTISLLAANVHIVAKKPLVTLYDVSREDDNKEIQRFRLQLIYNPITLTGSFFPLTRSSILKFISTIITYELVLLQLNKDRKSNLTDLLDSSQDNITNRTVHSVYKYKY
ncbi:hypothetical protein ABMA27_011527 [Loxostege sticticalis]|uniref:Gustatory receptor n=1 Tax=Loxostege sticticalis TaxID=481309 RepID=A0ABR3IGM0_LOXSC